MLNNASESTVYEMIYVIVDYGKGSKVLRTAKEYGLKGGTIFLGKGTVNDAILKSISIYEERKEILLIGSDKKTADYALEMLNERFKFGKPNHGIMFTITICGIAGTRSYQCKEIEEERGADNKMYQIIMTIVNKGNAEEVIDAATKAGSKGGTIINARGSGVNETRKLFNMDIEPEKEIVLILAKRDATEGIVTSIREQLETDKPGNGIIFIQDVSKTYGIHE